MSDFCFNGSERIARKTGFPRSEIIEVDKFLARKARRQFKLHDIEDFTNVKENAEPIINEYIKQRVVKKEKTYLCPKHEHIALEPVKGILVGQKGLCHKCEQEYPLKDREYETVFIRKKAPDRPLPSEAVSPFLQPETTGSKWWKDRKWLISTSLTLVIIFIALINLCSRTNVETSASPTVSSRSQSVYSSTPTSSITPTFATTPATSLTVTLDLYLTPPFALP